MPERKPPRVSVAVADITKVASELVVVDAYEGAKSFGGVTGAVDKAAGGALSRILRAGDFKGSFKETMLVHPTKGRAKRVLLVGMGEVEKLTPDRVRRIAAVVARRAREIGVKEAHLALPGVGRPAGARVSRKPRDGGPTLAPDVAAEAFAEGALLGLYKFDFYKGEGQDKGKRKGKDKDKPELARLTLVERDPEHARAAKAGAARGVVIAEATNQCRDHAAYAGADAAPERYAERARELAAEHGLRVEVLDRRKLEERRMGGILAVGSGSKNEPRLVVLEHAPRGAKHTICVVGKGICFDSGGISIKPSEKMEDMKMDKSGAAAVMAAVVAAARLELPLRVVGIAPFAENLPSGTAYKPGDVVRTASGKTIEIINTDAEGRVVLADALHHAASYAPAAVVELSTLTGGCVVAVGHHCIAAMGNSDGLMDQLRKAGLATNERLWPMPFFDEYGEMVKSKVADVKNSAGRIASSITAGKFLENFIGDHPWVHLDIASTAWHEGPSPKLNEEYCPEYATGIGTRLLIEWMRHFEPPAWEHKKARDSGAPRADADRRVKNRRDDRGAARLEAS